MPIFIRIVVWLIILGAASAALASKEVVARDGTVIVMAIPDEGEDKVYLTDGMTHVEQESVCTDTPVDWLYAERSCTGSEAYKVLGRKMIPMIVEPTTERVRTLRYEVLYAFAAMVSMVIAMVLQRRGYERSGLLAVLTAVIAAIFAVATTSINTLLFSLIATSAIGTCIMSVGLIDDRKKFGVSVGVFESAMVFLLFIIL